LISNEHKGIHWTEYNFVHYIIQDTLEIFITV
jgi:hypothetical protein